VLVLGGGAGGLVTANELRHRLDREHRVVLVDREDKHIFWPSLLWLQVGLRKPENIVSDLALLEKKGIEVVKGTAETIDPVRKVVRVNGSGLEADYLVVSLGARPAPEEIPGLTEGGYNLYSLEGATAIRDARRELTQRLIPPPGPCALPTKRRPASTSWFIFRPMSLLPSFERPGWWERAVGCRWTDIPWRRAFRESTPSGT
jgi:NADPH-dependent 2,4-dienoyl-CoA reductase/sulfur reductase-like enzyme